MVNSPEWWIAADAARFIHFFSFLVMGILRQAGIIKGGYYGIEYGC